MKVLLVGHACSPRRGSEPGLTWNWAWHLSQRHQIQVLTHPQDREGIEEYLSKHPNPNLKFGGVDVPSWIDTWRPGKNDCGPGIRLHYLIWQYLIYREAARLHRLGGFDVVHHVSWGTITAPPLLWRLPVPFIWGPIGGGQTAPHNFLHYFGEDSRGEFLRTLRIRLLPRLPFLRRAVKNSSMLLATNLETCNVIQQAGGHHVRYSYDNAVAEGMLSDQIPRRSPGGELTLLWAGRLEPFKALRLGIEALAQLKDVPVRLLVAGDGSQRSYLERLTRDLGVGDRVQFLGHTPWPDMPALFRSADAFLFTSLRDSSGSVVLEAMSQALPIITLNHQGVATLVPSEAGVKIPVTTPAATVAALAKAISQMAASPEMRLRMGEAGWNYARTQTWERRAAEMNDLYEECVRSWHVDGTRGQYAVHPTLDNL
jgi:glycosyltransferase involved in cell wall biosynthesis